MAISFQGAHFPKEVILMGVRWYLAYPLSTRHVEALMAERGVEVDHSTINRWVIKDSPQLEDAFHRRKHPVWVSWRMDETYIRVKGEWCYLYRAVDKLGKTIDFLLTTQRDEQAAKRFLTRAIRRHGGVPETITIDGSAANEAAIKSYNAEHGTAIAIRQVKYLNNIVEIVFTQLTKTRGLTAGMRRDYLADFDRSIGHDDPLNQQRDQLSRLCKRRAL
jgi:putative transposase